MQTEKGLCNTPNKWSTKFPTNNPIRFSHSPYVFLLFLLSLVLFLFFPTAESPLLPHPHGNLIQFLLIFFSWPAHGRLSFTHWPPIRVLEASSYPLGVARSIDEVNIYIYIYIDIDKSSLNSFH